MRWLIRIRWAGWGVAIRLSVLGTASPARGAIEGLELVASGLANPLFVTHAPGDPDRLFIVERGGVIRVLDLGSGQVLATPFLTVSDTKATGEGGLLGLAFHPGYSENGRFFVYVTVDNEVDQSPFSSHVREYAVSADPNVAEPTPIEILEFAQPASNHNAGWLGFNPRLDPGEPQYLFITSGDGGTSGGANAQDLSNWFGTILRIDVDGDDFPQDPARNYAIPGDNPFVGESGADEIWAYGLRNPFRASFDRATGDLWFGDVGASSREEVDLLPAGNGGGQNYAWNRREGFIAHNGGSLLPGDVEPVYDYRRGADPFGGRAVIGGPVYRGPDPDLQGLYFFADQQSAHVWTFEPNDPQGTVDNIDDVLGAGLLSAPTSIGEDSLGNLFITDFFDGEVFAIATPEPPGALSLLVTWLALLACARSRDT